MDSRNAGLLLSVLQQTADVWAFGPGIVHLGHDAEQSSLPDDLGQFGVGGAHALPDVVGDPFQRFVAVRQGFAEGDGGEGFVQLFSFGEGHAFCDVCSWREESEVRIRKFLSLFFFSLGGEMVKGKNLLTVQQKQQGIDPHAVDNAAVPCIRHGQTGPTVRLRLQEQLPLGLVPPGPVLVEVLVGLGADFVGLRVDFDGEFGRGRDVAGRVAGGQTHLGQLSLHLILAAGGAAESEGAPDGSVEGLEHFR